MASAHICFSGAIFTSIPHPVAEAVFPDIHRRNNLQRLERNISRRNEYHQSSEKMKTP